MTETAGKLQRSWRVKPGTGFEWRRWGDECIVYNDATGDTHLFSTVALYILDELSKQPVPIDSLATCLFGGENSKEDMDVIQHLSDVLRDLQTLELVEPLTE